MNNKTILVTGTAGFIGFHLSKRLLGMGNKVIGIDNFNDYYDVNLKHSRNKELERSNSFKLHRGNLEDLEFIKKVFRENKIDKVCNLAAQAGVRYSLINPHAYIQSNIVGFTNLIDEAKNAGVMDFVYASSSSVYGKSKEQPFSESDEVLTPISLYAASKRADELIAHTYHHLYNMNCTGLRFFTVYGPYGRPDMALYLFAKAIQEDKPIKVFNYGKMKRDFTHIDDIVSGVVASLDRAFPYQIFNLGNNKTVELGYFIELIEKEIGKKAIRELLPIQPGDVPETVADISHAQEMLGYDPKTSVEEGVREFVMWFKKS